MARSVSGKESVGASRNDKDIVRNSFAGGAGDELVFRVNLGYESIEMIVE